MRTGIKERSIAIIKYINWNGKRIIPSIKAILPAEVKVGRRSLVIFMLLTFFYGCAGGKKSVLPDIQSPYSVTNISAGLPTDGLRRENLVLHDINGSGFSSILAPPPRQQKAEERHPYIFVFDAKEQRWSEAKYSFPDVNYDYGGISVGDINKDGLFDVALATHSSKISILLNNGIGGFREMPFPIGTEFHSRAIKIVDINGDGWPDIVAISEGPFIKGYKPKGLLVGINREGKDWDTGLVEGSLGIYSDSIAVGDINGDGNIDIAIAPSTSIKEEKKILWLGDGKGGFTNYPTDFTGDLYIDQVQLGDIDGDGLDELVTILSSAGPKGRSYLKAYKWGGSLGLQDISEGLQMVKSPLAFDVVDLDGDGKKEIVLLAQFGLHVLKYGPSGWVELLNYYIPNRETLGAKNLRVASQADGSFLIAYNLGREPEEYGKGLRAYLLNLKKGVSK